MCKTKKSAEIIQSRELRSRTSKSHKSSTTTKTSSTSSVNRSSSSIPSNLNYNSTSNYSSTSSIISRRNSLSALESSLPENPCIYDFPEILKATGNFLLKPFSSSSSSTSWRCEIRGKDVILFQRKFRLRPIELPELQQRLSTVCRSHHSSLIKLLGAATSGHYIYLVYEYVNGPNLATCLRNPQNPNYTVLSNWLSRMQIATDVAHGLDYIHHCSGLNSSFVHNHIKSSTILVSEGSLSAKICHFGTCELCGEIVEGQRFQGKSFPRTQSKDAKIEGTRGYMAPEFQLTGIATQKSDVYAFGVVILELVSGEEALRYLFDEKSGGYKRISLIDRAREALADADGGVRRWVDRRLKDSYPVDVAEKMVLVALECVEDDPENRPDMGHVAGRVSRMYLESKNWTEKIDMPTDFSVSMVPR